jgi:hypothetical protein
MHCSKFTTHIWVTCVHSEHSVGILSRLVMQALVCPCLFVPRTRSGSDVEVGSRYVGTDASLFVIKVANLTCCMSDASAYSVTTRTIRPYTKPGPPSRRQVLHIQKEFKVCKQGGLGNLLKPLKEDSTLCTHGDVCKTLYTLSEQLCVVISETYKQVQCDKTRQSLYVVANCNHSWKAHD